jgi:hypothetical protein
MKTLVIEDLVVETFVTTNPSEVEVLLEYEVDTTTIKEEMHSVKYGTCGQTCCYGSYCPAP